jgi:SAM-dependent methyltransferase
MKLSTLWQMMGGWRFPTTVRMAKMLGETQRASWLAAASKFGVIRALADGPLTFEVLAQQFARAPQHHQGFASWLRHGVLLKQLRHDGQSYALRGSMTRRMATDDAYAAIVEGMISVQSHGLYNSLQRWTAGETLAIADVDASTVARISTMLTPLVEEVLDAHLPTEGAHTLLEIGCGTGHYLRHACTANVQLQAHGLELDAAVAQTAREANEAAALGERIEVTTGDVQDAPLPSSVDTALLINLLYYLPVSARAAALQRLAETLAPGGRMLVAGYCAGGGLGSNILDLWFSTMPETGPLPTTEGITADLEAAGLSVEAPRQLMPGEPYMLVVATRGS